MALVGLDGRWLKVNPAICDLLGYSQTELLMMTTEEVTAVPEGNHPGGTLAQFVIDADPLPYRAEKQWRRKDGSTVWVHLHGSLVLDSHDHGHSVLLQVQDVTARHQAQDLEERMFELPIALHYVAGFDGYFKKLSASWEAALGYSQEYLLSVPYLDLVHPEDRQSTIAEAKSVEEGSNTFLFENRYRHADGTYRWILWTSVTAPEENLIYGVALDYTRRKEAELKLAKTVTDLETVLAELNASQEQIAKLRSGLITICAWTKQIFHEGSWIAVEEFLSEHLKLSLTHGMSHEAIGMMRQDLAATIEQSKQTPL